MELRARVDSTDGKETTVHCSVFSEGKERAKAEVVAVRVPESWRGR